MTAPFAARFGAGFAPRRVEDDRLIRGRGRYADNLAADDALHAAFLRSPYARARIVSIDCSVARARQGVVLCLAGDRLRDVGLRPLPFAEVLKQADGSPMACPPRWPLALEEARYVGDPVVLVVAQHRDIAQAAIEQIDAEFEELPSVIDLEAAVAPDAPPLWPSARGNVAGTFSIGDAAAVEAILASAPHVTRLRSSIGLTAIRLLTQRNRVT